MYYRKHIEPKSVRKARLIIAVVLLMFSLLLTELALRPAAHSTAENRARAQFGLAVSDAVIEVMGSSSPATVSMGEDGTVSYISIDSAQASRTTALIARNVAEYFDSDVEIAVPVGALTGFTALSGVGPDVTMRVRLLGAVETELETQFEEAGINQTLHRVVCTIAADGLVLFAGRRVKVRLTSSVTVAETVIVGATPDSFTSVNGDKSDTIGQIFDYGDPYGEDVLE